MNDSWMPEWEYATLVLQKELKFVNILNQLQIIFDICKRMPTEFPDGVDSMLFL